LALELPEVELGGLNLEALEGPGTWRFELGGPGRPWNLEV
jgi:hypothetical protein